MPPKKKTRVPSRARSVDSDQAGTTPTTATPAAAGPSSGPNSHLIGEPVYSDGWTDEQEITLFKAIAVYRWKPAGMHKHFRMLAIEQMMRNHGVSDAHTNTEGIWRKLNTLYNLEGIDEREDMDDDTDTPSFTEFKLPEEDFGEMMASRRLNPEGTASPSHALDTKRWRRFSGSTGGEGGAFTPRRGGATGAAGGGGTGRSPSIDRKTVASTAAGAEEDGEGDGSEDGDGDGGSSEVRSSPISQRSAAQRKRGGRLSAVRGGGIGTPRGGAGGGGGGGRASGTATPLGARGTGKKGKLEKVEGKAKGKAGVKGKATPVVNTPLRRKGKARKDVESEDGKNSDDDDDDNDDNDDENDNEEDDDGGDDDGDDQADGSANSDDDDDEEEDEDDDDDDDDDDQSSARGGGSTNASSPVSTPRGGGGRRGRGGGGSMAKSARGASGGTSRGKAAGADVRRSSRKK